MQQSAKKGDVLREEEHLHERLVGWRRRERMEDRRDKGREQREEQRCKSRPVAGGEGQACREFEDARRVYEQSGERHAVGLHELNIFGRMDEELVHAGHQEQRSKGYASDEVSDITPALSRAGNSVEGCFGSHAVSFRNEMTSGILSVGDLTQ